MNTTAKRKVPRTDNKVTASSLSAGDRFGHHGKKFTLIKSAPLRIGYANGFREITVTDRDGSWHRIVLPSSTLITKLPTK